MTYGLQNIYFITTGYKTVFQQVLFDIGLMLARNYSIINFLGRMLSFRYRARGMWLSTVVVASVCPVDRQTLDGSC